MKKNNKKSVDSKIKKGVSILHDDITNLMNGIEKIRFSG